MSIKFRFVHLAGKTRVLVPLTHPLEVTCPKGYRPLCLGEYPQVGDISYLPSFHQWVKVLDKHTDYIQRAKNDPAEAEFIQQWWLNLTVRKL